MSLEEGLFIPRREEVMLELQTGGLIGQWGKDALVSPNPWWFEGADRVQETAGGSVIASQVPV